MVTKVTRLMRVPKLKRSHLISVIRKHKALAFAEKEKRKKFDSRAEAGILLGYSSNSKTYLIGSFENGFLETLQTRNVTFNEKVFPGSECFHRGSFTNDDDINFER